MEGDHAGVRVASSAAQVINGIVPTGNSVRISANTLAVGTLLTAYDLARRFTFCLLVEEILTTATSRQSVETSHSGEGT